MKYFFYRTKVSGFCYSGFGSYDQLDANGTALWVLGDIFLAAYYSEYDTERLRVGFARSNKSPTVPITTKSPTTTTSTTTIAPCIDTPGKEYTCRYFSSSLFNFCNSTSYLNGVLFVEACRKSCKACKTNETSTKTSKFKTTTMKMQTLNTSTYLNKIECFDSSIVCHYWIDHCHLFKDNLCAKTCNSC